MYEFSCHKQAAEADFEHRCAFQDFMWTLAESDTFDPNNCEYLQLPEILGASERESAALRRRPGHIRTKELPGSADLSNVRHVWWRGCHDKMSSLGRLRYETRSFKNNNYSFQIILGKIVICESLAFLGISEMSFLGLLAWFLNSFQWRRCWAEARACPNGSWQIRFTIAFARPVMWWSWMSPLWICFYFHIVSGASRWAHFLVRKIPKSWTGITSTNKKQIPWHSFGIFFGNNDAHLLALFHHRTASWRRPRRFRAMPTSSPRSQSCVTLKHNECCDMLWHFSGRLDPWFFLLQTGEASGPAGTPVMPKLVPAAQLPKVCSWAKG